jgi:phosphatidylserine decarboxylase
MIYPRARKGLKIGRALRTAARFPAIVSASRGSGRKDLAPKAGETPLVILRLQIISCNDLVGKDKNGSIDPCVFSFHAFLLLNVPQLRRRIHLEHPLPHSRGQKERQPGLCTQGCYV